MPDDTCLLLGLDNAPHWLRLDELKRFIWPGFDLRPLPGKSGTYAYGDLPEPLYVALRAGILGRQRERRRISVGERDTTDQGDSG